MIRSTASIADDRVVLGGVRVQRNGFTDIVQVEWDSDSGCDGVGSRIVVV